MFRVIHTLQGQIYKFWNKRVPGQTYRFWDKHTGSGTNIQVLGQTHRFWDKHTGSGSVTSGSNIQVLGQTYRFWVKQSLQGQTYRFQDQTFGFQGKQEVKLTGFDSPTNSSIISHEYTQSTTNPTSTPPKGKNNIYYLISSVYITQVWTWCDNNYGTLCNVWFYFSKAGLKLEIRLQSLTGIISSVETVMIKSWRELTEDTSQKKPIQTFLLWREKTFSLSLECKTNGQILSILSIECKPNGQIPSILSLECKTNGQIPSVLHHECKTNGQIPCVWFYLQEYQFEIDWIFFLLRNWAFGVTV